MRNEDLKVNRINGPEGSGMSERPDSIEDGGGATCNVAPRASQEARCLYCGSVLDRSSHAGGKPQEFCRKKPCRRLFWQKARRVGGQVLRRRRSQGPRRPRRRMDARTRRLVGFLLAAGSVVSGIPIPADAIGWVTRQRQAAS